MLWFALFEKVLVQQTLCVCVFSYDLLYYITHINAGEQNKLEQNTHWRVGVKC